MKRNINPIQVKNADYIKSQIHAFRDSFVNALLGSEGFHPDDLPLRGIQLHNFGVKVGFGYPSWNAFKTSGDADAAANMPYAHLIAHNFFIENKEDVSKHIKRNYLPDVELKNISDALTIAAMHMPKYRTKHPLTKEGRKLCYKLCEQQLKFTKVKASVQVEYRGDIYDGIFTGFTQSVDLKTGLTDRDYGMVYIKDLKGVKSIDVSCIRPSAEFDCFEAYRSRQVGESYKEVIAGRHELNSRERKDDFVYIQELGTYVTKNHAVIAAFEAGMQLVCAAQHPITREVVEVEVDKSFDLQRLRELLHDTQELIFATKH